MPAPLSPSARAAAVEAVQVWFQTERDETIGDLQASFLLDAVLAAAGPAVYNAGVRDAQAHLLRLVGEQGDLPGVHADHAGDPAGRAARAHDVADRGVELDRARLEPVEPLGLEQPEETGLLELLDVGLGDDPQPLGLLGPLPDGGQQVTDPVEHRLRHRTLSFD